MTVTEIKNVRPSVKDRKETKIVVWENLQLLGLAMTIIGQVVIGGSYLLGQTIWFAANILALFRDFVLQRPLADKIKNACLTAITFGLIALRLWGWY